MIKFCDLYIITSAVYDLTTENVRLIVFFLSGNLYLKQASFKG